MYRDLIPFRQKGFGLPTAIFILVIMALLATAMIRLVSTQAIAIADETFSTRSFYAAESGAQYGANQLFPLNNALPGCPVAGPLNPAILIFNTPGLNNCQATVACVNDGNFNGIPHYTLTSTGRCGTAARVIQVRARQRIFVP